MTTITIDLPDQKAAALTERATAYGLTLEEWIARQLLNGEAEAPVPTPQEAAAHLRALREHVKPDPDGWTIRDHIDRASGPMKSAISS